MSCVAERRCEMPGHTAGSPPFAVNVSNGNVKIKGWAGVKEGLVYARSSSRVYERLLVSLIYFSTIMRIVSGAPTPSELVFRMVIVCFGGVID